MVDNSNLSSNQKLASFLLESADDLSSLFQTLANERRIEILANLVYQKQSLSDLQGLTGFQTSMLGNHLSLLSDSGLIKKLGRGVYDISIDGLELLQEMSEVFLAMKIREKRRLEFLQSLVSRYTTDRGAKLGDEMTQNTQKLNVRIVELPEFHYVMFHALGRHPEKEAIDKMKTWAKQQGYLENMAQHAIYGFNNPDPQKGKEEYGYEIWIEVDPLEIDDENVDVMKFNGGRYAVTTTKIFPLNDDGVIPAWPELVKWVEDNGYEPGSHQWLEKSLTPFIDEKEAYLDLYLPIE